jgi:hypothetical protein
MQRPRRRAPIVDSQPVSGVWLRSEAGTEVKTVSSNEKTAEFRLEHGRLNVSVHQPAQHLEILVDLPGGQTSLLKDGMYTFNADTNTVRVLRGEAAAYTGVVGSDTKPIKVKEDHQLAFVGARGEIRSVEAYPFEMTADLLPLGSGDRRGGEGYDYGYGYGDGAPPYGYGYYGYPYYAGGWGYPYGWGYGYPIGYGIGFGYYGGFHRGFGGFRR